MKKSIILSLISFISVFVYAQQQTVFNKTYRFENSRGSIAFGATEEYGTPYMIISRLGNNILEDNIVLFRFNETGDTTAGFRYCTEPTEKCYLSRPGIRMAADGENILICGSLYNPIEGDNQGFMIKMKPDGERLWVKNYGEETGDVIIHSFMLTPDGGYALCGFSNSFGANGFYLCKTDGEGNMQWQRSYPAPGWPTAYSIDRTHDGGYMLVGKGGSIGAAKIIVMKTDSLGNQEWMRIPAGDNDGQHRGKVLADGNILVVGALGGWDYAGGFIVKYNPQGQVLWQRAYPQPQTSLFTTSIIELDNGDFVVGGSRDMVSSTGTTDIHGWLCRFNAQGQMQWQHTYYTIEGRNNYFYEISPAADGGYYGYGFAYSDLLTNQSAWLVKTDSEGYTCQGVGCVSIAVDVPEPGPQGQAGISCEPNPVSDHLRVYYALPAGVSGTQVRVVLRDIAGRELMSAPQLHPHSEGYAEFQVAGLPAGVYVAQVEVAGRLSAAAKVIKR